MAKFIENNLDIGALKNPSKFYKLHEPNLEKSKIFVDKLVNDYLYLPDEKRDYKTVWNTLMKNSMGNSLTYEIGDFGGIMSFVDIIPFYKCTMTYKLWDKALFGKEFVRESARTVRLIKDALGLIRVGTSTADPLMVKLGKLGGFKVEGVMFANFSFDGTLHDEFLLSMVYEPDKENIMIKLREK